MGKWTQSRHNADSGAAKGHDHGWHTMARRPHRCPTLRAILAAMTSLRYLIVDGTPHALDRIEPADANRLRLLFTGPAPELRDRVH